MGGDGGGGNSDNQFLDKQKSDEDRKAALRAKLNQFYGLDGPVALPDKEQFRKPSSYVAPPMTMNEFGFMDNGSPPINGGTPEYDDAGYAAAVAAAQAAGDPVAKSARDAMAKEETDLAGANRSFYTEDLRHSYDRAERNNRFALADRGLLGGSAQVDSERELNRDNTLGATRIEDQARQAISGLRGQREQERLNATQLINAGAGEDAIAGAQAGLKRAFDVASSQSKANIAGDLFANTADTVSLANQMTNGNAALLAYRNAIRNFTNPSIKGSVTGTA